MTAESHCPEALEHRTTPNQDRNSGDFLWNLPSPMNTEGHTEGRHSQKFNPETQVYPEVTSTSDVRQMFSAELSDACNSVTERPSQAALKPLKDCILAILWEISNQAYSSSFIADDKIADLVRLLSRAAVYQAGQENVRLVSHNSNV
jgi:hypothetical protein